MSDHSIHCTPTNCYISFRPSDACVPSHLLTGDALSFPFVTESKKKPPLCQLAKGSSSYTRELRPLAGGS